MKNKKDVLEFSFSGCILSLRLIHAPVRSFRHIFHRLTQTKLDLVRNYKIRLPKPKQFLWNHKNGTHFGCVCVFGINDTYIAD